MSTTNYEDLAQEVLTLHGVRLGQDDPILMVHTINQRLARDMGASIDEAMAKLRKDLEELHMRWDSEGKARADRLLSAAVNAANSHLTTRAEALVEQSGRAIEDAASSAITRIERSAARLESWVVAAIVAALVCAGSAIWMVFFG